MTHEEFLPRWIALWGMTAMALSGACISIQAWFSMSDHEAHGWRHRPWWEWVPMMGAGLSLVIRALTIWLGSNLTFGFLIICVPMMVWQVSALARCMTQNLTRRAIARQVANSEVANYEPSRCRVYARS